MKHIKIYEKYKQPDEVGLKKLLSHITKMLTEFGFGYSFFLDYGDYETEFTDSVENATFYVRVSPRSNMLTVKKLDRNSDVVDFIPEYFKSIRGLKYINKDHFSYIFNIVGNVDKIISQISKEDFDFKLESKKYNI